MLTVFWFMYLKVRFSVKQHVPFLFCMCFMVVLSVVLWSSSIFVRHVTVHYCDENITLLCIRSQLSVMDMNKPMIWLESLIYSQMLPNVFRKWLYLLDSLFVMHMIASENMFFLNPFQARAFYGFQIAIENIHSGRIQMKSSSFFLDGS